MKSFKNKGQIMNQIAFFCGTDPETISDEMNKWMANQHQEFGENFQVLNILQTAMPPDRLPPGAGCERDQYFDRHMPDLESFLIVSVWYQITNTAGCSLERTEQ